MFKKVFADLESHWRDNQEQWYFHLPYNHTRAALIETNKQTNSQKYPKLVEKDTQETRRLLNENSSARTERPSCELLTRETTEALQIIKAIATAVGCMSGPESKTLLMKTPHVHPLTL